MRSLFALVIFMMLLVRVLFFSTGQVSSGPPTVEVALDARPSYAGIDSTGAAALGTTFTVDVMVRSISDLRAFNFDLVYDQTKISAPIVMSGLDVDRNPDANQSFLTSTGRTWSCSPPAPSGDIDSDPDVGVARISCFSSGGPAGPTVGTPWQRLASVTFNANALDASAISFENVNTFKAGSLETGSCNPVVVVAATCTDATVTVVGSGGDADGDGCTNSQETGEMASAGGLRNPNNFWDFFDTPDPMNVRDKAVAGTDFFRILGRFGSTGDPAIDPLSPPPSQPAYHSAFDRGNSSGPNVWNLTMASGAVAGTDFFAILAQFGHSCS